MPTPVLPQHRTPLLVRTRDWPTPLTRPRMANAVDRRPGLELTNRHLLRDGRPVVPVSGEVHYSRIPRSRWAQRLAAVRAGGITAVSTYVVWIHHEPERGRACFDGGLDLAAFVDACEAEGLDVVLRLGPWVHGEVRNGGFPDWVQAADVRHRTDDPAYLDLVRAWFAQIATALAGRCRAESPPVLALQLENELYDQPEHLRTLERLAREAGMSAPLWTATAWGGADLPEQDVLPLYGGYGDGFWVDADHPWDPTFREHFFFSHTWDDPGIGADVRENSHPTGHAEPLHRSPSTLFPPATCELGGGMATAYHRRPHPAALDIAAVANCKIGNGSAWQGYYVYAGGTNPAAPEGLQESHASDYPNDLPRLSYDFHAPVGEAGTLAESHAHLRRQHAFLAAFGAELATKPSTLPEVRPADAEDRTTLRWAVRADAVAGRLEGFLLLSWHQPHVPLSTYRGAQFRVEAPGAPAVVLPSRGVDVPVGTLARWPLGLTVGGVRLAWATASALTVLPGTVPTLVLTAEAGIDVEVALALDVTVAGEAAAAVRTTPDEAVRRVVPGLVPLRLEAPTGALDLLVLPATTARHAWVQELRSPGRAGGRRLLLSAAPLTFDRDDVVTCCSDDPQPDVFAYEAGGTRLQPLIWDLLDAPARADDVPLHPLRPAGRAPELHGERDGRASAPDRATIDRLAAQFRLDLPTWVGDDGRDPLLHVQWAADVAELRVDGRTVSDRFWDGSTWTVNLRDAGVHPDAVVTLHVVPLAVGAPVHLPAAAARRRQAAGQQLCAVDAVRVTDAGTWRERVPGRLTPPG